MRTTAAVIVAAALVLVAVLGVWPRVPPPSEEPGSVVRRPEEERRAGPDWGAIGATPAEARRLGVVPSVSGDPATSLGLAGPEEVGCDQRLLARARDLLDALAAEQAAAPDDVHEVAAALIGAWVDEARDDSCPAEAWSGALVVALDGGSWSEVVHGCALAGLAALGADEAVAGRHGGRGETWRGAVLGRAWRAGLTDDEVPGLALDVGAFLEGRLVGRLPTLPLELVRVPPPEARVGLEWALVSAADDWDEQLDREVALLALATGLDDDPVLLDVYAGMLTSAAEQARQVLEVVVFCLQRSRRPEARRALEVFAGQELHPRDPARLLQSRLQLWLAGQGEGRPDVGPALERVRDRGGERLPRLTALASLEAQLQRLDADQLRQTEEQLALLLEDEADAVVVSMALALLGDWPGDAARLAGLDQVLRTADNPLHRLQAARGLAATTGARRNEALTLLRRHRPDESDADVLAVIDAALESGG